MVLKALRDPDAILGEGLAAIRGQFQVPAGFPPEVEAAAAAAARRPPKAHVDRTGLPFVTLDPASSTDLDQAFTIEQAGADLLLRYAIADVAWFVRDGDVIDTEAWRRGVTLYLPDGNLRPLEEIEADVIRLAIGHYRGRMSEVARRLGIGRSTLYRKLGELGIGDAA